jgi:dihydropteroate synthase
LSRSIRIFEKLQGPSPLIMGILNVTPDSFSDGGRFCNLDQAVLQAQRMVEEGADIIDIGGESTRPGAEPVKAEEQLERVVPVIRALRRCLPESCLISVDTTRSAVAEEALGAGADLINDISAGLDDPGMFEVVAKYGVPIVLMHMQGTPKTMQDNPHYANVVDEVATFLEDRAIRAQDAGILGENIILDPGIGFGKRRNDNLRLIAELGRLVEIGYPILLGTSRKRFMGAICGESRPTELLGATVATTALGVAKGVKIFRVHDVRENRQAADVVAAVLSSAKNI